MIRRRRPSLGRALVLVLLAPALLAAQQEDATVRVAGFELNGVQQVDEGTLRSVLATKAPGWLPWSDKPVFDRVQFEADLHRIRAFYVDRGFPDAQVSSFDIQLNQAGTEVDLTIEVEEGEPITVSAVRLEGLEEVPERRLRGVRRRLPIQEGAPFDRAAVATSRETLADVMRDFGYPYPRVSASVDKGATGNEVGVTFTVTTGERAYFGETTITGDTTVGDGFIRRSLLFEPGDVYDRRRVQETQRKLYGLDLFEFVNVAPVRDPAGTPDAGAPDAQANQAGASASQAAPARKGRATRAGAEPAPGQRVVPMRITVTESNHNRVRGSIGYGTEEQGRVEGQYRKLNFLGGGRSAGIHAKYSALDRGVRGDFVQPFVFGPRWSFSVTSQRWYNDEPAYYAIQSGGHMSLTYGPGLATSFTLTATSVFQSSRIRGEALEDLSLRPYLIAIGLDPRTGGQDGTLNALSFDFRRNTAQPNLLNAFRGYSLDVHLEQAVPVLTGTYSYSNVSLDARHYRRLYRSLVLATRVQAGSIAPADGDGSNVPFSKRYFLGGSGSLRGWGRYEVSPLSGSGLPLGGFSMFQFTAEARMRLFGQLGGVVFVDAGNVWEEDWEVQLDDLRYTVGPGLRYNTPIGPVRIDLGYQLNPLPNLLVDGKPESRRWRVHFSIGQAF